MPNTIPFFSLGVTFDTSGPRVLKTHITMVLPFDFPGKDDFMQFYLNQNGGTFYNGAFLYRDAFYKVSKKEPNQMSIEFFYSIPRFLGDGRVSLIDAWEDRKNYAERYAEFSEEVSQKLKKFTETHFPFAESDSYSKYWIEIETGKIKYLEGDCGGEDDSDDVVEVAPSFRDFCTHLQAERRD